MCVFPALCYVHLRVSRTPRDDDVGNLLAFVWVPESMMKEVGNQDSRRKIAQE